MSIVNFVFERRSTFRKQGLDTVRNINTVLNGSRRVHLPVLFCLVRKEIKCNVFYHLLPTKSNFNSIYICLVCGPGSTVGIATDYGLDGPGSNPGGDFPPVQTGPRANPAACTMGTGSFPGVKCGRGVLLTTHPLLVSRSWKSRAIPLHTLWGTPGL